MARADEKKGPLIAKALNDELNMKPGVVERTARALRLRNELQLILELVVNIRGRLEGELDDAVSAKFINKEFVTKLKDLTACYQTLTTCQVQLQKSEKAMEDAMTPQQERDAVLSFVAALGSDERYRLIYRMWNNHLEQRAPNGRRTPGEETLKGDDVPK